MTRVQLARCSIARLAGPLFAAAALGVPAWAAPQDVDPSQAITLVNPYPPGGGVDIMARALVAPLQRVLKQPVAVSYRSGAGGAVGIASVANAPPDGRTVLLAAASAVTIPEVDKLFNRPPSYSIDQLLGVALLSAEATLLVVNPSLPAANAREFIALARSHPGELVVSSGGWYGASHLPMAMLERETGVRFRHLVGNGGGPAMTAVLSGNAAAYAAPPAVVTPHILSGRARVLAHWGNKRLPAFPNLPSLRELGFTSEFYDWRVLFVPAKTPPAVVKALQDALRAAVQDPQFKAEMERVNQTMDYRDGGDFSTWYEAERKRLTDTVRAIGKVDEAR